MHCLSCTGAYVVPLNFNIFCTCVLAQPCVTVSVLEPPALVSIARQDLVVAEWSKCMEAWVAALHPCQSTWCDAGESLSIHDCAHTRCHVLHARSGVCHSICIGHPLQSAPAVASAIGRPLQSVSEVAAAEESGGADAHSSKVTAPVGDIEAPVPTLGTLLHTGSNIWYT